MEWLKDKWKNFNADLRKAHRSLTIRIGVVFELLIEFLPELSKAVADLEPYVMPETHKRLSQLMILAMILVRFRTNKALRDK